MTEDELREVRLYQRQARWETPKAVAMIVIAAAALGATSHIIDWLHPTQPQLIIVRMEHE